MTSSLQFQLPTTRRSFLLIEKTKQKYNRYVRKLTSILLLCLSFNLFGAGPHTNQWRDVFIKCTNKERIKCRKKYPLIKKSEKSFWEYDHTFINRQTIAMTRSNQCISSSLVLCSTKAGVAEREYLSQQIRSGAMTPEQAKPYIDAIGAQNDIMIKTSLNSIQAHRNSIHNAKVTQNIANGDDEKQMGVIIDCKECNGQLNSAYKTSGLNNEQTSEALGEWNTCLKSNFKDAHPLSEYQARIALEMLGEIPARIITPDETQLKKYKDDEINKVMAEIKKEADAAEDVRLDPTGTWGSSNCLTHARRMTAHLQKKLSSDHYNIRVVNTYKNIPEDSRISMNAIAPVANHYQARVTDKRTGLSYVVDGYTGVSVKREDTEVAAGNLTVFTDYEQCFYQKVYAQRMGHESGSGLLGAAMGIVPTVAIVMSREAKDASNQCRKGYKTYESSDYFDNQLHY